MTPWKHSESSAKRWGGYAQDYIHIHNWLDETKQFTGDWTHRALRHHAAGIQWAVEKFGDAMPIGEMEGQGKNRRAKVVPTKMVAEQHIIEDCGFIPTVEQWLTGLRTSPEPWMLRVQKKSKTLELQTL